MPERHTAHYPAHSALYCTDNKSVFSTHTFLHMNIYLYTYVHISFAVLWLQMLNTIFGCSTIKASGGKNNWRLRGSDKPLLEEFHDFFFVSAAEGVDTVVWSHASLEFNDPVSKLMWTEIWLFYCWTPPVNLIALGMSVRRNEWGKSNKPLIFFRHWECLKAMRVTQ